MKKQKKVFNIGVHYFDAIVNKNFDKLDESQFESIRFFLMMNSGEYQILSQSATVALCAVDGVECLTVSFQYTVPSLTETALNYDEL